MSTRKKSGDLPKVIVRSFGNEPVVLVAHRLDQQNNRVFVGNSDARRPISLPFEDVFDYEETRFATLKETFTSGNKNALQVLYDELLRKSPCNRYQDALKSLS